MSSRPLAPSGGEFRSIIIIIQIHNDVKIHSDTNDVIYAAIYIYIYCTAMCCRRCTSLCALPCAIPLSVTEITQLQIVVTPGNERRFNKSKSTCCNYSLAHPYNNYYTLDRASSPLLPQITSQTHANHPSLDTPLKPASACRAASQGKRIYDYTTKQVLSGTDIASTTTEKGKLILRKSTQTSYIYISI